MSLFAARADRARIAAFVFHEFPHHEHERNYTLLDQLAAAFDAEIRIVHEVAADPTPLTPAQRARCGTGILCPQDRLMHRNDVEHLRRTLPGSFDALIDTLREFGQCSRAAVLVRPELQAAASAARWVRAYAPDLIVSFGLGEAALQAWFTAQLLDVPRLHVLDRLDGDSAFARLLPLHLQQCAAALCTRNDVADALRARFGATHDTKLFSLAGGGTIGAASQLHLNALFARPCNPARPRLGPRAAFCTAPQPASDPAPTLPQPLLVMSAERCGSNMLVGALDGQPLVRCANELFNTRLIAESVLPWIDGDSTDATLLQLRLRDPAALHRQLLTAGGERGATVVGCKLLYAHGLVDDRVVDHFASLPKLRIVHLTRRDRLRRLLSLVRARGADDWYTAKVANGAAATAQPAPPASIVLEAREVATDFAMNEQFEQRFRAAFASRQLLELDYEDLNRSPTTVASQLGELLGVPIARLQPRSLRTGSGPLDSALANRRDLQRAFAGTRWSQHFADEISTSSQRE